MVSWISTANLLLIILTVVLYCQATRTPVSKGKPTREWLNNYIEKTKRSLERYKGDVKHLLSEEFQESLKTKTTEKILFLLNTNVYNIEEMKKKLRDVHLQDESALLEEIEKIKLEYIQWRNVLYDALIEREKLKIQFDKVESSLLTGNMYPKVRFLIGRAGYLTRPGASNTGEIEERDNLYTALGFWYRNPSRYPEMEAIIEKLKIVSKEPGQNWDSNYQRGLEEFIKRFPTDEIWD